MLKIIQSKRWHSAWFVQSMYPNGWPTWICITDDFGDLVPINRAQFRASTSDCLFII